MRRKVSYQTLIQNIEKKFFIVISVLSLTFGLISLLTSFNVKNTIIVIVVSSVTSGLITAMVFFFAHKISYQKGYQDFIVQGTIDIIDLTNGLNVGKYQRSVSYKFKKATNSVYLRLPRTDGEMLNFNATIHYSDKSEKNIIPSVKNDTGRNFLFINEPFLKNQMLTILWGWEVQDWKKEDYIRIKADAFQSTCSIRAILPEMPNSQPSFIWAVEKGGTFEDFFSDRLQPTSTTPLLVEKNFDDYLKDGNEYAFSIHWKIP